VPVERLAAPVVAHRRARVGVRCGLLDIAQRYPGVEGGGDEGVAQAVRGDPLGDPHSPGQPLHCSVGGGAVHSPSFGVDEDRPDRSFADVQVKGAGGARCQRDGEVLAALADDSQRAMATIHVQVADVGAERFGDAQPIQRQQDDQGVIACGAEPGLHQQGAEFVVVQPESA
jgi:hypothetical protein